MDDRYILANLVPVGQVRQATAAQAGAANTQPMQTDQPQDTEDQTKSFDQPFIELFADHFRKFIRVEEDNAFRNKKKSERALSRWITDFYPRHRDHVAASIQPSVSAFLAALGRKENPAPVARQIALDYINASRDRITNGCAGHQTMTAADFAAYWGQAAALKCKGEANGSA